MLGHVTFGEEDFTRGAARRAAGRRAAEVPPDDRGRGHRSASRNDPTRQAGAHGYVECDALGGRLPVERGVFNLFVDTEPGVKRMLYRLWFRDGVGHPLTLSGHKLVRNDAGLRRLAATRRRCSRACCGATSRRRTRAPRSSPRASCASGSATSRSSSRRSGRAGPSIGTKLGALVRFGWIFLGQLAETYLRKGRRSNGQARQSKRLKEAEPGRQQADRPHAPARRRSPAARCSPCSAPRSPASGGSACCRRAARSVAEREEAGRVRQSLLVIREGYAVSRTRENTLFNMLASFSVDVRHHARDHVVHPRARRPRPDPERRRRRRATSTTSSRAA